MLVLGLSVLISIVSVNKGGAVEGTLTASDFGTQKTLSGVSATNVVNFLIADADGTIVLAKETAI